MRNTLTVLFAGAFLLSGVGAHAAGDAKRTPAKPVAKQQAPKKPAAKRPRANVKQSTTGDNVGNRK